MSVLLADMTMTRRHKGSYDHTQQHTGRRYEAEDVDGWHSSCVAANLGSR